MSQPHKMLLSFSSHSQQEQEQGQGAAPSYLMVVVQAHSKYRQGQEANEVSPPAVPLCQCHGIGRQRDSAVRGGAGKPTESLVCAPAAGPNRAAAA